MAWWICVVILSVGSVRVHSKYDGGSSTVISAERTAFNAARSALITVELPPSYLEWTIRDPTDKFNQLVHTGLGKYLHTVLQYAMFGHRLTSHIWTIRIFPEAEC